jgi:hypothetical protein
MSSRLSVVVLLTCFAAACSNTDTPAASSTSSGGGSSSGGSSGGSTSSGGSSSGGPVDSGMPSDSGGSADAGQWTGPDGGVATAMNFFVTSKGNGKGGDFRANAGDADGLAGADAFCKSLALAVSPVLGAKTWRAYLSTATITARSRIGTGPYFNAKGVMVAATVAQMHDEGGAKNMLSAANTLDELGNPVPIAAPNVHDILTGATAAGGSAAGTCSNWTSNSGNVQGNVGHSNRAGGGADPTSWNAAHATAGCANAGANSVASGGGRGSIYCFAP